ncbi:hypothetical protein [Polystyrenella longa]|uniref:hypothetical protein n=1 Tax=Polystyrenella longa TaxID=2528007 RepID=UPI0011A0BE74|nr:hypothetical protein [Polystyrenella longa]
MDNNLERALKEYIALYHSERNHQILVNPLISPKENVERVAGKIECYERLGGLIQLYYRDIV